MRNWSSKSSAGIAREMPGVDRTKYDGARASSCETQIERFFRACGIAGGEAPLLSVFGFVADLLDAIPQPQSWVIGA